MSLPFSDRVVHQWLVEFFIKPYYIPRFSTQSFACIPGRGTHGAVRCTQSHLRRALTIHKTPYIVRCDIHQFFHSIDKYLLFDILTRSIQDPLLLKLLQTVIFTGVPGPGLPIGNYTSQYFANIYLNELDQYIKRQLKIKLYVRYMDDFLCFVPDKQTAKAVFRAIEQFVTDKLHLQLNPNSRYFPASHGLDFCGYRIYQSHKKLRNRSKRKLCQIIDDFESGSDSEERFHQRTNAWLGHALHADSFRYAHKKIGAHATSFAQLTPKDTKNNP